MSTDVLQWYTKREQGSRTGFWFSFNGWGQIFGGFISYAIAVGSKKHGSAIEPWKIVFLVNGLLTLCLGVVFFFVVPDNQMNARWLKKEDQLLAIERVRVNQQGIGNKHFKMYQLREALTDPLTWAFVFYGLVSDVSLRSAYVVLEDVPVTPFRSPTEVSPTSFHNSSSDLDTRPNKVFFSEHLAELAKSCHLLSADGSVTVTARGCWSALVACGFRSLVSCSSCAYLYRTMLAG